MPASTRKESIEDEPVWPWVLPFHHIDSALWWGASLTTKVMILQELHRNNLTGNQRRFPSSSWKEKKRELSKILNSSLLQPESETFEGFFFPTTKQTFRACHQSRHCNVSLNPRHVMSRSPFDLVCAVQPCRQLDYVAHIRKSEKRRKLNP